MGLEMENLDCTASC